MNKNTTNYSLQDDRQRSELLPMRDTEYERLNTAFLIISHNRDAIANSTELKNISNRLQKLFNVYIAKRKLKAMRANALPVRKSVIAFIKDLVPVTKIVEYKAPVEVKPLEIKLDAPLKPRFTFDWHCDRSGQYVTWRCGKQSGMFTITKQLKDMTPMQVWEQKLPSDIFLAQSEYLKDLTEYGIEPNPGPRTGSSVVKRKNKNKNIKKYKPTKGKNSASHFPLYTIQPRQNVQQNSCIRDLCFELPMEIFNNPGGPVVTQSFFVNDLFDVLPSILTPAVQFVNYMFELYKFAKVLSVETIHVFDNLEQTALQAYYFTSAQSLTAAFPTKDAVVAQAATAKLRWKDTMSEQYGKRSQIIMRKVLVPWMTLGMRTEYMSSNDFSFTQSTNPARLIYGAWVIIGPQATVSTGVTVSVTLNFRLKFYDAVDIDAPIFAEDIPVPPAYSVPDIKKIRAQSNRPVQGYSLQEYEKLVKIKQ